MSVNIGETKRRNDIFLLLSFAIPFGILLLVYAIIGISPFGTKSVLTVDLNNQYISFFSYLREILSGEKNVFYSFSKTLGGDMAGLNAYYLISPFNLILLLFPTAELPTGIALITLIKTGCCGLTFYLGSLPCEVDKKECFGRAPACLAFSAAYALMAYNIAYQQNLMWLDSVIMLPLVVKGIRKICKKGTPFLYLFSLFAAIVTNYYIGFMVCIFSVLFFLYYFFSSSRKKNGGGIYSCLLRPRPSLAAAWACV